MTNLVAFLQQYEVTVYNPAASKPKTIRPAASKPRTITSSIEFDNKYANFMVWPLYRREPELARLAMG